MQQHNQITDSHRLESIRSSGFVLRELLAVLSIVVLLGFLAAPGLRRFEVSQQSGACMNNQKQLIAAWQMYADENAGKLVENYHGGETQAGRLANNPQSAPWACGWMDWLTSPDNTNVLLVRDRKYARLAEYFRTDRDIHKCPSDSQISSRQVAQGWKERVRSYSMNITVGNGNAFTGPWDAIYWQAKKMSEFRNPSPAESSVLLDEHPDSINDPSLYPPQAASWADLPGNLHDGSGTITFADSHVEVHSWNGPLREFRVATRPPSGLFLTAANDPDRSWLSYHSQRRGSKSY